MEEERLAREWFRSKFFAGGVGGLTFFYLFGIQ